MATTNQLVTEKFDLSTSYAADAVERAELYMDSLEALLASLEVPSTDALDDTEFPDLVPIDYSAMPDFAAMLESFPSFDNTAPIEPTLDTPTDISVTVPQETFPFSENNYTAPNINIGDAPEDNTNLETITIPPKPDITLPEAPNLSDIEIPAKPIIDLPDFTAVMPASAEISDPTQFDYTEGSYNSDIRIPLFNKILNDIANGGTGLDVSVEADIYDRFLARQQVENDRLYQEVQDQFAATGFGLPSGAYASRLLQVSNDISLKNDQASREIAINQAELAQKNTHFTIEQARMLEGLLMEFFNQQENRLLESEKAAVQSSIEIFNSLVSKQRLALERYQTEAQVFESKIRAELAAVEIYKAQIEGVRAEADVQQARVNIYNAQLGGINTLIQMYATEMESAKIQAEVQKTKVDVFKAQIEAYATKVSSYGVEADVYKTQIEGERTRVQAHTEKVRAYQIRVEAKKTEAEVQQLQSENTLRINQQKIEEYKAKIDGYRAEIEAEIRSAALLTDSFNAESNAYSAMTSAKGMEYQARIQEFSAEIERQKSIMAKAVAEIEAVQNGYVALKTLQTKGTEGLMNANAELAASAMNAVHASASQTVSQGDSEGTRISESHNYHYTDGPGSPL